MTHERTELMLSEETVNESEGRFSTTPDGKYSSANEALARIYGFNSPEELIENITDIGRQLYLDPGRRKDGRVIWISENAREIRNSDGSLIGYVGTVVEVKR